MSKFFGNISPIKWPILVADIRVICYNTLTTLEKTPAAGRSGAINILGGFRCVVYALKLHLYAISGWRFLMYEACKYEIQDR